MAISKALLVIQILENCKILSECNPHLEQNQDSQLIDSVTECKDIMIIIALLTHGILLKKKELAAWALEPVSLVSVNSLANQ